MRRVLLISTTILTVLGLTACGEPSPKVGEPPESTPSVSETVEASASETPELDGPEIEEAAVEPEDDFDYGDTTVSLNEAYQMTAVGDWSIVQAEPQFEGYPEDQVDDPLELWMITHPDVDMQGEVALGTNFPPTAARPVFVVESMTEEELPDLSSHYGNAYLVEGLIEVGGETVYRVGIVTDHQADREISEALEYFGDRTPAPRLTFLMHSTTQEDFAKYRQSQARQDLLQMLRTLEIEDPPDFEEGVDLENPSWTE